MNSIACAEEFRKVEHVFTHVTFVVPLLSGLREMALPWGGIQVFDINE
jgi:hypothetical protein